MENQNPVVMILSELQSKIVEKEGDFDRSLQQFIDKGNCRVDNLYILARSHGFRFVAKNPETKCWHAYRDDPLEMTKQICFRYIETYGDNYMNVLEEQGHMKRTFDNWLQKHNSPFLKHLVTIGMVVGFEFSWIPISVFCKTCKLHQNPLGG